ncbi:MAG: hypothetical protein Q4C48_00555 [Lachnospiraceae bacterium]|nr:hypothetical protein [Lachnospiraceae bacterium]
MRNGFWNLAAGAFLCLCLLTACAGENGGKSTDPTGSARPSVTTTGGAVKPTGEATDPTPSAGTITPEAPSPTDAPEREVVADVSERRIFCGYHYFAVLREDGTVAALGALSEQERQRMNEWKEIKTLCDDKHTPSALTRDGSVVLADQEAGEIEVKPVEWISLDGMYDYVAVDSVGELLISPGSEGSAAAKGASAVQAAGAMLLDRYGVIYPMDSIAARRYEKENMAEWDSCVCLAYSNRSGDYYAVRTDGTVLTTAYLREIPDWTELVSISVSGGMVVGLKRDGTVVAHKELEGKEYGNYAVEEWRDVVEVATNGYYTVGRTSDGRLLCTEIPPEAKVPFTKEDVEALASP